MKSKSTLILVAAALLAVLITAKTIFTKQVRSPDRPRVDPASVAPDMPDIEHSCASDPEPPDSRAGEPEIESAAGAFVVVECPGAPTAVGFVSFAGTGDVLETVREHLLEGRTRLAIPPGWFEGRKQVRLAVGVAGIGIVKTVQEVDLHPGETRQVVITPPAGQVLRGRLLDQNDCGIPRVWIVGRTSNRRGAKQASHYDSDEALYSAHPLVEARTLTAEDGSFQLSGLLGQAYFLTTSDPLWVIVPTRRPPMTPPMEDIELRAVRPYRLDLTVLDSETGEPVDESHARLHIQTDVGSSHFAVSCANGRNTVSWPPRGSAMDKESGFALKMTVGAFGYETRDVDVRFGPCQREVSLTVELTPNPMGELVLEVLRAHEGTVAGKLTVAISRPGDEHVLILDRDAQTSTFRHRVPAGTWTISVYPCRTFGPRTLASNQRIDVPENGRAEARVQLAPYGSLAIDRGPHRYVSLKIRMMDDYRVGTVISDRNPRIRAIRAGVWPYVAEVVVDGGWMVIQQGMVEIRDGEEAVLKIEER
jgi:hypothetical protein